MRRNVQSPKEIVAQLHAQVVKALKLADVKERLEATGYEAIGSTPEEYAAYTRAEIEKWPSVVKTSGVHAD